MSSRLLSFFAPTSASIAVLMLFFGLASPVHADETSTASESNSAVAAQKESNPPPGVDVWQYLASPFGDPPALPTPGSSPTSSTAAAEPVRKWPEEYWNCLLLNLRGMGSDLATRLVAKACQEKYPQQ